MALVRLVLLGMISVVFILGLRPEAAGAENVWNPNLLPFTS